MDTNDLSALSIFPLFIPLLLVLIVFVFSFFLNIGNDNIFFNIVGVLVLLAIILIDCRTIFDNNIISNTKINLNFFDIQTSKIKIMLYLTFISNILLMIYEKKNKIHS
jgi:FtsH-binding integral membrane protein